MPRLITEQEQALKKTWLQRLEADRAQLLLSQPFTAMVSLNLEMVPVWDSRIKTAATDGRTIYFQVRFIEQLSDSARIFVLAHEVWHVVCGHIKRKLNRDMHLWNIAVDHEVNALLQSDGLVIPSDAIYFARQEGKSAEAVYEWLISGKGRGLAKGAVQFDEHDIDGAFAQDLQGSGNGDESGNGDDPNHQETIIDPDFAPKPVDEELQRIWKERLVNVANSLKSQGKLPSSLETFVKNLVDPQLPWQDLMRQFTQRVYGGSRSWLPPARRHIYRGLYLPSMRAEALRVAVAIDTSGSTDMDLPVFLSELKSLLKEFQRVEVTLIECDAAISRVRVFTEDTVDQLDNASFKGGGGTDLRPPFRYLSKESPVCLIYLTDGYGPAPKKPPAFPVLWVLTPQGQSPCDWGQMVFLR